MSLVIAAALWPLSLPPAYVGVRQAGEVPSEQRHSCGPLSSVHRPQPSSCSGGAGFPFSWDAPCHPPTPISLPVLATPHPRAQLEPSGPGGVRRLLLEAASRTREAYAWSPPLPLCGLPAPSCRGRAGLGVASDRAGPSTEQQAASKAQREQELAASAFQELDDNMDGL